MSDGSSWKPNWRDVWIGSAVMSAALSALLTFAVFVQERPGSSFNRWEAYLAVWVTFFTMLTLTGVIMIFRMTYSPDEFAERHSGREDEFEEVGHRPRHRTHAALHRQALDSCSATASARIAWPSARPASASSIPSGQRSMRAASA